MELDSKKRAGNKDVTTVRGLHLFGLDPEEVSRDWQRLFACSVSVGLIPGMTKEKEILMQGNMISELERCLQEQCNIPRELIQNLMTGRKKKK